jgi:PKD repeat protein
MDEVSLFNRELSSADIAELYASGAGLTFPGSSDEAPTYAYLTAGAKTATVVVTDARNCTATDTVDITIAAGPTAEFTSAPVEGGLVGEGIIQFTDATSGGTAPYTYAWDMGDGSGTSTDQNPLYTFSQGGGANPQTFTVTLTVTDNLGGIDSVAHDVSVTFNT